MSCGVARAYEDALGEIEFKVEVVVTERVALFCIEQLKQSATNVTFQRIEADLVNLINDNDWVLTFKSLQFLDEDAWL